MFSIKYKQCSFSSSSSAPCFCAHLLIVFAFHSCTSLRHGSVSQLSGGGRGRDPAAERSLIGWFGKIGRFSSSLSFSRHLFFSFLLGFFQLPSPHYHTHAHTCTDWQQGKAIFSGLLTDKHVFLFLFQHYHLTKKTSLTEWHASA